MRHSIWALIVLAAFACQQQSSEAEKPMGNEVQWVRQSVEYQAICQQVYRQAWQAVKAEAARTNEDWVVILDIDETVLDNSRYQEMMYGQNKSYPYYWGEWRLEEKCPPVPGVKAFLDSVRTLGERAHIAYITNRADSLEGATISNMMKQMLWDEKDVILCRKSKADTKEIRRQEVIQGTGRCDGLGTRKVLALIGDQLPDMQTYPSQTAPADFQGHFLGAPEWGQRYFILPNPMYGYGTSGYGG